MNWRDTRVLVTGARGFLGRALCDRLQREEPAALLAPSHDELDLRERDAIRTYLREQRPDLVIHGAARVGGIGANREHPGLFFYENAAMGLHLIEESRLAGVKKFVGIGTVCAYPKFTPTPFREDDLWNGYPEETNAPYGLAKKMMLVQLQSYRQEYGFDGIFLLPANMYGPHDNFDPATSHVIPAMILKFATAKETNAPFVELWGDGSPTREFLYVHDAVEGILAAAANYESPEPLNLGTGVSCSIAELATMVAGEVGYRGEIRWDTTKPNGQPLRQLDVTRAEQTLGWRATTALRDGLKTTVGWFLSTRALRA